MKLKDVIKDVIVGVEVSHRDVDVRERIPDVSSSLLTLILVIVVVIAVVDDGNLNMQQSTMFEGTIQLI